MTRFKNNSVCLVFALLIVSGISSCKKFLDKKQDQKLATMTTLSDFQALLDANYRINNLDPGNSDASADEYYVTTSVWSGLRDVERRTYVWAADGLFNPARNAWSDVFSNVYTANSILEQIDHVDRTPTNSSKWDNVKGQALFLRARSFLEAAYIWTLAYDKANSVHDLGLPLRLNTNFNQASVRATNEDTYSQVIKDLKASIRLLPVTPLHVMRASLPAAYALTARTYLSMREYSSAKLYADSCLNLYGELLDYNTLPNSGTYRIPQFNRETIFYSQMASPTLLSPSYAKIDTTLYASFDSNDLRRMIFFRENNDGSVGFYGSYSHSSALFSGIAADEVYLIRAECYAREGNTSEAMNDLNTLLVNRWKTGTLKAYAAGNATEALGYILEERRKELIFRGLRWMDIKRLNMEGANIELKRLVNGQLYLLPPNDLRFALPIPEDVIELSGMPQNPR